MNGGVLVFGGSRGTGLHVARLLDARGDPVTVFVRAGADIGELLQLRVRLCRGDILDPDSVTQAFAAGRFRAVVCTVGGRRGEPRPDFHGVRNLVNAAERAGVRRIVLVSAIGAGDSRGAVGPRVIQFLGAVLEEKTLGENALIGSGLDYTIVRPGGMNDGPPGTTALLTPDPGVMGVISRADLARLTVGCLDDPRTIGRIFHAVDPGIGEDAPLQRGENLPGGPVR
jgi:uncharacterized protein YbjT (DUF2867 family)